MAGPIIKTPAQISIMRESGRVLAVILERLLNAAVPGVKTIQLDDLAAQLVKEAGVAASFKGFEGYKYNIVTCLNEEVVHGMPSQRVLIDGDVLTIDFGVIKDHYHSDMARTKIVGTANDPKVLSFLNVGERALCAGIDQCVVGNRIGDIGHAIQQTVERGGYQVVRAFVGHGVGIDLHEEPQVPGFGSPRTGPLLREGMVLAVEVMYAMGSHQVKVLSDGWTAVTIDGSLSGMFENTVAITADGPLILTRR